jgi:5-formyltetrahydrofolate cyclo-ligase
MTKDKTRIELSQLLDGLSDRDVFLKSFAACEALCATDEFQKARSLMTYLAMPKELDTSQANLQAFKLNKTVAVPRVVWDDRELEPVVIYTLNCPMDISRYGLRNPSGTEIMDVAEIDMVVVPGLGFDEYGDRLGRGAGFYDRFLASHNFNGIRCGLAFEEQIAESIPVDEHDMRLDMLVTDKKVRHFKK